MKPILRIIVVVVGTLDSALLVLQGRIVAQIGNGPFDSDLPLYETLVAYPLIPVILAVLLIATNAFLRRTPTMSPKAMWTAGMVLWLATILYGILVRNPFVVPVLAFLSIMLDASLEEIAGKPKCVMRVTCGVLVLGLIPLGSFGGKEFVAVVLPFLLMVTDSLLARARNKPQLQTCVVYGAIGLGALAFRHMEGEYSDAGVFFVTAVAALLIATDTSVLRTAPRPGGMTHLLYASLVLGIVLCGVFLHDPFAYVVMPLLLIVTHVFVWRTSTGPKEMMYAVCMAAMFGMLLYANVVLADVASIYASPWVKVLLGLPHADA